MSKHKETFVKAFLGVADVEITNPGLDEAFVQKLIAELATGKVPPEKLGSTPIFVRIIEGRGYCVNNGNHTVEALKRAGVKMVQAEVYRLSD
mgnify:CR=1 FL=1